MALRNTLHDKIIINIAKSDQKKSNKKSFNELEQEAKQNLNNELNLIFKDEENSLFKRMKRFWDANKKNMGDNPPDFQELMNACQLVKGFINSNKHSDPVDQIHFINSLTFFLKATNKLFEAYEASSDKAVFFKNYKEAVREFQTSRNFFQEVPNNPFAIFVGSSIKLTDSACRVQKEVYKHNPPTLFVGAIAYIISLPFILVGGILALTTVGLFGFGKMEEGGCRGVLSSLGQITHVAPAIVFGIGYAFWKLGKFCFAKKATTIQAVDEFDKVRLQAMSSLEKLADLKPSTQPEEKANTSLNHKKM